MTAAVTKWRLEIESLQADAEHFVTANRDPGRIGHRPTVDAPQG